MRFGRLTLGSLLARFVFLSVGLLFASAFMPTVAEAQCDEGTGGVKVTPCNGSRSVFVTKKDTFNVSVKNSNPYESATVSVSCGVSGKIVGCNVSPSTLIIPKSGTKSARIIATAATTTGSGQVTVYVSSLQTTFSYTVNPIQDFTLDTATINNTDGLLSLCSTSCFAGTASFSTVPFYTFDIPRNVGLTYTEERTHPRPVIYADIALVSGSDVPDRYTLAATLSGTAVTFLNGDAKLHFSNGGGVPLRLAGQFDASTLSTDVYQLIVTVEAIFPGGATKTKSYLKPLIVVNESNSPIGKGWTVMGVQRLRFPAIGGYLITDGRGDAVYYPTINTRGIDFSTLEYDSVTATYARRYLDGTRVIFQSNGYHTSTTDRLGFTTTIVYDGMGRIQTIKEPMRDKLDGFGVAPYLTFTYGTYGLARITEMGGNGAYRVTTTTVASDSTLRTVTDPDGLSTSYTYDGNKRLSSITNRQGGVTTLTYHSNSWKLIGVDLPQVPVDIGGGNTASRTPKVVYTPWQTIGVPYTSTSTVTLASPALQSAVAATVTDPIGRTTTMTVDRWGQPMRVTDALSQVTQYTRTGYLLTQVQYPDGSGESYSYVYGTPLVSQATLSADSSVYYRYGVLSQVDSVWGMGVVPQRRFLDSATGRVDSVRFSSADSTMVRYIYDAFNRVIRVREPDGREVRYRYEWRLGNRDSVGLTGGIMSIRRFDGYGRDSVTWSSGAKHWTRTVYDSLNRVRKQWSVGFPDDSVIISYDALFPIRVRTRGGQIHKFEYNALGWLTKSYDVADTTRFLSYRYDTAGRMTSMTNRRNQRIDLKYDAIDRLLVRSGMNIPTDSFTYQNGSSGRIVSGVRGGSRDLIFYNWRKTVDSLVHQIDSKSYTIRYKESKYSGYIEWETTIENDTSGGRTSIPFASKVSRLHPGATTLDSVFVSDGAGAGWFVESINRNGELQSTTFPSPPSFTRWYNYSALHAPVSSGFTSGAPQDSLNRGLGYDSLGRLTRELRTKGLWTESRTFSYDTLGQLLKVERASQYACGYLLDSILGVPPGACDDIPAGTYDSATYDVAGNRLVAGASYGSGNRLLTWPGYSYTYDLDGNVATRTHSGVTDSLFWSAANQLDSIRSGGLRVVYDYDAFGRLIRRRKNGVVDRYFLWDGTQLIAELAGSGTARIAQYIYHGGVDHPFALATDSAGTSLIRYFAQDMQGNVIGIMRNTALHQYNTYTAWGQFEIRAPNTLADTNRLGWKGLLYEGDSTKLYYMRNRWYDPQIGRFLNQDPVGLSGGTNLYTFAGNDPINGFDPWGLAPTLQEPYLFDTYFVYGSMRYRESGFLQDGLWDVERRSPNTLGFFQQRPHNPYKWMPYDYGAIPRKSSDSGGKDSPSIDLSRLASCLGKSVLDNYGITAVTGLSALLATPIPKSMIPPYRTIGTSTTNLLSTLGHYVEINIRRIAIDGRASSNLFRIAGRINPYVAAGLLAVDAGIIGYNTYKCYEGAQE